MYLCLYEFFGRQRLALTANQTFINVAAGLENQFITTGNPGPTSAFWLEIQWLKDQGISTVP